MDRSLFRIIMLALSMILPAACSDAAAKTAEITNTCMAPAVAQDVATNRVKLAQTWTRIVRKHVSDSPASVSEQVEYMRTALARFDSTAQIQLAAAALADSATHCTK